MRAFVNWCGEHAEYRGIVNADACKSKKAREKIVQAAKDFMAQTAQKAAGAQDVEKGTETPAEPASSDVTPTKAA